MSADVVPFPEPRACEWCSAMPDQPHEAECPFADGHFTFCHSCNVYYDVDCMCDRERE